MAQMIVRGLDDRVYRLLKARAESNGRSLEAEARVILTDAVRCGATGDFISWSREFSSRIKLPKGYDSMADIRASRGRDDI